MTTTTVIVNDFETNRRTLTILEADDFEIIAEAWETEDRILHELQGNPYFEGRKRWCDLDPTHFRLMILRNLTMVASLNDDQRADRDNAVIRSLHFLLCAMIYCLQRRSESLIELLRINRINDVEVTYDYSASLNMYIDAPTPHQDGGSPFRIVVDNEKE